MLPDDPNDVDFEWVFAAIRQLQCMPQEGNQNSDNLHAARQKASALHPSDRVPTNPDVRRCCFRVAKALRGIGASMFGQRSGDRISRVEQDRSVLLCRDLDKAQSSQQENSFDSQQGVADLMRLA